MADNIVESLFGPTPWQIEQQRYQQMNQSADKYASQDPFQRAAGSMYRAGGMLGGVGASAMGMVDPAVAQAQQQQAMMQGVTPTAKGLRERAMQIQDPRMKFQLEMLARKMESEEADLALKSAHAQYYQQSGNRTSASAQSQLAAKQAIARNDAMKWALNAGYKGQDLIDFVESQVQKVTDTWIATTGIQQSVPGETALSPSTSVSNNLEITQEQKDAMIQDAASRGDAAAVAKIQGLPVAKTIALPQSKAEVAGAVKLAETIAANNPVALAGGAAAKASGKEIGEASGKATVGLVGFEDTKDLVQKHARELLSHPGFSSTVGATLLPGMRFVPGTDEAGFMSRLNQIKGGSFLKAYETLKGGGSITEIEGQKATDAINRMNISTSESEFKKATEDFLEAVDIGFRKLKAQAKLKPDGESPAIVPGVPSEADINYTALKHKITPDEVRRRLANAAR